jgi:hypothetical protein
MGEFKPSWSFELSASANIWLLSASAERAKPLAETLARKGLGKVRAFKTPDELARCLETSFGKADESPVAILCDAEHDTKVTLAFLKDLRVNQRCPNLPVIPLMRADDWDRSGPSLHTYGVTNALVVPFTPG